MKLKSTMPMLLVDDIEACLPFYKNTLEFEVKHEVRNGAGSLNFVLLAKAGHNVALVAKPCFGRDLPANMMQHLKSPGASYLYHSVQNLDFDRISKQVGVELLLGPCGSGVGSTEVYVLDASGHVHIFGQ